MSSRNYALKAAKREQAGKGVARALRRENKVPAVIYGDHKEPLTIALPANAINLEYNKGHMYTSLCDMDVDGQHHLLLVRDVQVHPVTDAVIHADFLRVTPKTRIAVEVPVNFINQDQSEALKEGGILNVVRHEIEMMCVATEIPDHIDVDLAGAEMGDSIRVSKALLPQGATPVISNRDFVIATIQAPKTAEQLEAELAAEIPADGIPDPDAPEGEAGAEGAEKKAEGGDAKAAKPEAKGKE